MKPIRYFTDFSYSVIGQHMNELKSTPFCIIIVCPLSFPPSLQEEKGLKKGKKSTKKLKL